ncbi:core histone macro-H2A.2 isoform X2 [Malaclemys terrapin pileata]|uniref:core histone macro-H2A.2 isoform X2 n=1 Tax=Malaclemys terrapin pileata TaxID=2991368 RepID=UPI0023A85EA5|nr:core histone macro-H2A.2 isoform X2 [Malaclemys terrapin pileata]
MSARSGKKKMSKMSRSSRAGVIFPVGRMMRYLRKGTYKYRIGVGAPVYMAAVIEYLAAEILELAGNAARDNKKGRIAPRHILLAVANDEELNQLLKGVTIASGGVLPRIQPELLAKKRGAKGKSETILSPSPEKRGRKSLVSKKSGKKAKATKARAPKKSKQKENEKEGASNSTSEDGPGDGFTILSSKSLVPGQKLSLTQSDVSHIGSMKVEGIVHPTTAEIDLKEEIGKALEKAGGKEFLETVKELRKSQGPLEVAEAALSQSSGLAAKFVIHCHIPQWGSDKCEEQLEETIKNCLTAAEDKKLKSVAFPPLPSGSTRNYGMGTLAPKFWQTTVENLLSEGSDRLSFKTADMLHTWKDSQITLHYLRVHTPGAKRKEFLSSHPRAVLQSLFKWTLSTHLHASDHYLEVNKNGIYMDKHSKKKSYLPLQHENMQGTGAAPTDTAGQDTNLTCIGSMHTKSGIYMDKPSQMNFSY